MNDTNSYSLFNEEEECIDEDYQYNDLPEEGGLDEECVLTPKRDLP